MNWRTSSRNASSAGVKFKSMEGLLWLLCRIVVLDADQDHKGGGRSVATATALRRIGNNPPKVQFPRSMLTYLDRCTAWLRSARCVSFWAESTPALWNVRRASRGCCCKNGGWGE